MTRLVLALLLTLSYCAPLPYTPPRPDTVRVASVLPVPPLPEWEMKVLP